MIDLGTYKFKYLNTGMITPGESFMNAYAEEINESEQVCTSTKWLRVILDSKYENSDSYEFTKNQCQYLAESQHNELLILLQKIE